MLFHALLNTLHQGEMVITPTNRLQRELLWQYAHHFVGQTIPKPLCFSYESFLQYWFEELQFRDPSTEFPLCLNPWQFYLLWKNISENHTPRPLNHFEIKQAISTYKNCALALRPPIGSDFLYTPIAEKFQKMVISLDKTLEKNHWLAPTKLADFLAQKPYPFTAEQITWAFFDCFHPQQEALLEHLRCQGVKHHFFDFPDTQVDTPNHQIYAATDTEDEQQQMIQWLKNQQQNGLNRIGVVIPDFSQQAKSLYRVLKQHFNASDLHFSLGDPLWSFPLIKQALSFLKLKPGEMLSQEECKILLLSPFIKEQGHRQTLLQHPLLQEPFIPWTIFLNKTKSYLPQLSKLNTYPEKASAHEWIEYFEERLNHFGFPGEKPLNDNNQSILSKFYLSIESLQNAALILPELSFSEALDLLEKFTQDHIHQPPQNYHGIHFMGWLESSGFCGDALWICHFQSDLIPQPIHFSPLLPIHWQKKNQLARTQVDKEFEMAQRMLQRFINAHIEAPLVISYAKIKNEEPLWPSPLLPAWHLYEKQDIQQSPILIEKIAQNYCVPLKDAQTTPKGGYQVLASLANCPFQAFANYRLHSQSSIQEEIGLNASERGRLMHRALQYIWQELKDQHALLRLTPEEIQELCLKAIHQTLDEFQNRPYSLDELMMKLEAEQLLHLILPCLEADKQREYFQIEGLEQSIHLKIDDWSFQLRYDRLDKLANGDLVIIDYKSKSPTPLPWDDERPIHPQILMYALAQPSIRYLLFLSLSPKEFKSTGFGIDGLEPYSVKVSKEPWEVRQQQWLITLKSLINEFQAGHCIPAPLSSSSCRYCHNRDICRQEKNASTEED